MSKKAGALLWHRMRITLQGGDTDVDTGVTQLGKSFENDSLGEPPLGISGVAPPPSGTLPASRVDVVPMAPTTAWTNITHSEPYFNTTTNTVHVVFTNASAPIEINVLFWDPHTIVGPGQADTYNALRGNIGT